MATLEQVRLKADTIPEFCRTALGPKIQSFEETHKVEYKNLKNDLINWGIPAAACGLLFLIFGKSTNSTMQAIGSVAAIAGMICGWFATADIRRNLGKSVERFKAMQKLLAEFKLLTVGHLDSSFKYNPQPSFPSQVYLSCGLFESYDSASAEDQVSGMLEKTEFDFREVKTYRKETYKDSQGRRSTRYVPLFTGILFMADFHKNFKGHTIIQSDWSEKTLGVFGRAAQRLLSTGSSLKLVELENPEFELHFKVSSNDQTEARYLLSPTFMEALLRLKDKYGKGVQVAFLNSTIIIAIPHTSGFMNVGMNLPQISQSLEKMGHEVIGMLEIVEDLELNNRIWNKTSQQAGA